MKYINYINSGLALASLAFFLGCSSVDRAISDTTLRMPTTSVDVYKDGKTPDRKYKEIAEMTYLDKRENELKAQRLFIKEALKIGGNGIIMSVTPAGLKGSGSM
jgi:hypothetical protein